MTRIRHSTSISPGRLDRPPQRPCRPRPAARRCAARPDARRLRFYRRREARHGPTAGSTAAFPVTITDDSSRTVTVKAEPQRIVSLAPANTEIAFALGLGDKVVGVTTYDDYPAEVTSIAKVGDFSSPNIEAIAAAKPDLVLATSGVQADVVTRTRGVRGDRCGRRPAEHRGPLHRHRACRLRSPVPPRAAEELWPA